MLENQGPTSEDLGQDPPKIELGTFTPDWDKAKISNEVVEDLEVVEAAEHGDVFDEEQLSTLTLAQLRRYCAHRAVYLYNLASQWAENYIKFSDLDDNRKEEMRNSLGLSKEMNKPGYGRYGAQETDGGEQSRAREDAERKVQQDYNNVSSAFSRLNTPRT
jgi:hypothetical protein